MIVNLLLFINFNIFRKNEKLNFIRNVDFKINFDKKVTGGYDERYNTSVLEDHYITNKIKINNMKYETLKYLENDKVSLINKINYLENIDLDFLQRKIKPNITSGGLFKEWEYSFDFLI